VLFNNNLSLLSHINAAVTADSCSEMVESMDTHIEDNPVVPHDISVCPTLKITPTQ